MRITNENEEGSAFWAGSCLLRWVPERNGFWKICWYHAHKAKHMGISYSADACESEHGLYIGIKYLFNWYLHFPMSRKRCRKRNHNEKEWNIRFHDWRMWVDWANDSNSWTNGQAWWLAWNIDFAKLIFGAEKYSKGELGSREGYICLPDGKYLVKMTKFKNIQKRSRWWARRTYTVTMDVDDPNGIPSPGKGENAWDCGDNNLQSMSTPAKTFEEAMGAMTASVLRTRQRHGGSHSYTSVDS